MRVSWDQHFMTRAYLNAQQSTCRTRQVGAVATRGNRSVADGFNGNLPGHLHCDEGGCDRCATAETGTGLERCVCVHAEANLVAYCALTGTPLYAATVYTTTRPCLECMKLLLSSGVTEIVYDDDYAEPFPETIRTFMLRKYEGPH